MVGVEHLAGVYLANPPAAGSLSIAIAVLAILIAASVYEVLRDRTARQ